MIDHTEGWTEADPEGWSDNAHFDCMKCAACGWGIGAVIRADEDRFGNEIDRLSWVSFWIDSDGVKRCEDCTVHYSFEGTDQPEGAVLV